MYRLLKVFSLIIAIIKTKWIYVCVNSLVNSTKVLTVTQVQFPAQGPLQILSLSLPHTFLCSYCPI